MQTESATKTETKPVREGMGKIITLGERGPVLPLGTVDITSGTMARGMTHKVWKFKEERELAKLRESSKTQNLAQYVNLVIGHMFNTIGGHDLAAIVKEREQFIKRGMLSTMWMGDIYYAYVWLRIESLGHELKMKVTCPFCQESYPFIGDLRTIDVRCFESLADAQWTYQLRHPFETKSTKIEKFLMGPARWSALESAGNPDGSIDTAAAKMAMLLGSIHGIVDAPNLAFAPSDLDELSKWDIEHLFLEIVERYLGPRMAIDDKCQNARCAAELTLPIEWSFDSFFGGSSS